MDASGKSGFTIEQLIDEGATIKEESESSGILYFTRHYRLREGQDEPDRRSHPPATGDLGYLKFGVFPGDGGNFSITIAIPEVEMEMRKSILNPDIFHQITLMLPGLYPWTNETRSEGTSKVFGMGDLQSRWRDMVVDGKPAARGYFALGDTLIRTNPLYGRGCSFAAVSAQRLRETLDETADPAARAIAYYNRIAEELRPFYLTQRRQDRTAIKRAKQALTPGYRKSLRAKIPRVSLMMASVSRCAPTSACCAKPCAASICWSIPTNGSESRAIWRRCSTTGRAGRRATPPPIRRAPARSGTR